MNNLKPSILLNIIWKELIPKSRFLDLGCGQGSDSLFMAKNDFKVTAVDISKEAINALREDAKNYGVENLIETTASDVRDFQIQGNTYDAIQMSNVLQFLTKEDAMRMIENVRGAIKDKGYILISAFTDKDPSFDRFKTERKYFESQELSKLFLDFSILYYYEGVVLDQPHKGMSKPHKHGVARLIAKKIIMGNNQQLLKKIDSLSQKLKTEYFFVVFGGFAVDAYFGKLTRPHNDVDFICWRNDMYKIRLVLKKLGYKTKLYKHYIEKELVYKMSTSDKTISFQIADLVDIKTFEISFWHYTHLRFPLKYLVVKWKNLGGVSIPVVARQMLKDLNKKQITLYEKMKKMDSDKFEKQKDKYEKAMHDIKLLRVGKGGGRLEKT